MDTGSDEHGVTYNPQTNTYCLHHDWARDHTVALTVTRGIAVITNTAPTELDPLYEQINADALNQLFSSDSEPPGEHGGRVTFTTSAYEVTVYADGTIEIRPCDES